MVERRGQGSGADLGHVVGGVLQPGRKKEAQLGIAREKCHQSEPAGLTHPVEGLQPADPGIPFTAGMKSTISRLGTVLDEPAPTP